MDIKDLKPGDHIQFDHAVGTHSHGTGAEWIRGNMTFTVTKIERKSEDNFRVEYSTEPGSFKVVFVNSRCYWYHATNGKDFSHKIRKVR